MNLSSVDSPDNEAFQIALRPERSDDEVFMLALYASTREEELAFTNWDAATRSMFIKMQFNARRQDYASTFPDAQFSIVLNHEIPIGRIVVDRAAVGIRLVDFALLPIYRGRGIGGDLLRQLLTEARQAGKPVQLSVLKTNRAALLYERLGFVQTAEDDFYRQMEWRPATNI